MRKTIFLPLVVVLLFVANMPSAFACSCPSRGTPTEELNKATAVFSGKVIGTRIVQGSENHVQVTFDVSTVWKGPVLKTITVKTADNSAACGYDFPYFRAGKEYIIFAYGEEGDLSTGTCAGTALRAELGEGKTPESAITPPPTMGPAQILLLTITGATALITLFFMVHKKKK